MIHADFGGPDWLLCTIRMAQAAKRVRLYSYVWGLNMDQIYHSTTLPLVLAVLCHPYMLVRLSGCLADRENGQYIEFLMQRSFITFGRLLSMHDMFARLFGMCQSRSDRLIVFNLFPFVLLSWSRNAN